MKPYYTDEHVTLYHGDCREITDWLDADVLVTDPPYGMAYQSGSRAQTHARIVGDESIELRDAVLAMWSSDKPALVFGTWRQPRPADVRSVVVWDKTDGSGPGMGNLDLPFGSSHEEFYLLGPWKRVGKRRGSVVRTSVAMGNPHGEVSRVGHPTAKPLQLMEQLVDVTPPGCLIADPFSGGGATLIAAKRLGRRAIGVELDERYCEITANRLAQQTLDFTEGTAA